MSSEKPTKTKPRVPYTSAIDQDQNEFKFKLKLQDAKVLQIQHEHWTTDNYCAENYDVHNSFNIDTVSKMQHY